MFRNLFRNCLVGCLAASVAVALVACQPQQQQKQGATSPAKSQAKPTQNVNKPAAKPQPAAQKKQQAQKAPELLPLPKGASLTLLTPKGGEEFKAGSTVKVTWKSQNLDGDVALHLYENGKFLRWLVWRVPVEKGSMEWQIKPAALPGKDYTLRLISRKYMNAYSDMKVPFSIVK